MTEAFQISEPENIADDSSSKDSREPVIRRLSDIAMENQLPETLTQTGMVEEPPNQEQIIFEQGPPGWLVRKAYDHKGVLISVGAISVGVAALTAAGITYAHRRKHKKI